MFSEQIRYTLYFDQDPAPVLFGAKCGIMRSERMVIWWPQPLHFPCCWLGAVVPAGDVTSKNARSAANGSAGVAARFWPKKASIAVNHHSADGMLPLLLVCCVCLCRRVWSAVLLCCRVVCCVKGKRRVSTEMSRRYLPRVQGMFCLDAKRLDRQP